MRIRAKLTIRNDAIISARERLGLSQRALSEAAGVGMEVVGRLERLQFKGVSDNQINAVASFLCLDVDTIAPPRLRREQLPWKQEVVKEVSVDALIESAASYPTLTWDEDASEGIDRETVADMLRHALGKLSERDRAIVEMRTGMGGEPEHTFDSIAETFHISPVRAAQLFHRAIYSIPPEDRRRISNALRGARADSMDDA